MKKLLCSLLLLCYSVAEAQFTPGQLLTASALNTQFALYAPLAGATFTGSVAANAGLTASAITGTPISGSTGSFTNLSASGTVALPSGSVTLSELAAQAANTIVANGTGSTASPTAVSIPSCSTSSSGLQWTSGTGFACNTSINAATLGGTTFAAPGPIGSTTASTGAFTTLSASSTVSGSGFSTYLSSPPAIGNTSANSGAFTTLSASSTVSGSGFSTYLASPPSIGTTTPAAGKFTTLQATSTITPSTTSGLVGTVGADNAQAGSWGEYTSVANTAGSAISTSTNTNVTSISLTAGDWRVCGSIEVDYTGTNTGTFGWLTTTSAGNSTNGQRLAIAVATGAGSNDAGGSVPCLRVNSTSTSTVYLVGVATFSGGSATAYGQIWADRRR